MPFEFEGIGRRKIAVIGGGISGMGAAYMLGGTHDVTLIEAEPRLGGHARTIMAGQTGNQPVDTGFLVFNYANYPHLAALFHELAVPVVKSSMSFGASVGGGKLEYGLAGLRALFAQPLNIGNPKFLRMVRDIWHFNKHALHTARSDPNMTVADLLKTLGTGPWFRDYYLFPLSGAIWSTPTEKIADFPAHAMIQFFENHALLHHTGQHQWYTVQGGSIEYVSRLQTAMERQGVAIRLGDPVQSVRRTLVGPQVKMPGGEWEGFDDVIFATHSDDTLRMMADPTPQEFASLSAIRYQPNTVTLHADANMMPKRRAVWSSWNYTEDATTSSDQIDLTYWLNSLQPIPESDPHFVTLNTRRPIREELIYDQTVLRHPVYDLAALDAQTSVHAFNGDNATWFCGAWMGHGFHEDGLLSAVTVAEKIASRSAMRMAAE